MAFVVDDLLISYLVVPVATRLGQRWLDQIADTIDAGLRELLQRLVKAVQEPKRADREQLVQAATEQIDRYVERNRQAAQELATVATPNLTQLADDVERLEALFDFLDYMFHMVAYLKQPVALPGFFTGVDQIAVIDVRTSNDEPFKSPMRFWGGVIPKTAGLGIVMDIDKAPFGGVPRIWLLSSTEDPVERSALLLSRSLAPEEFARAMENYPQVKKITPTAVVTVRRRFSTAMERLAMPEAEREAYRSEQDEQMSEMSSTPDGVISMRDALICAVEAESDHRRDSVAEWSKALGDRPG